MDKNTKRRRDYLDNIYYVNGVKSIDKGQKELGMRAMTTEEKEWLNRFNKEYYCAEFEDDDSLNLHQMKAPKEEIQALRDYISELRTEAREEKDRDRARDIYEEIEAQVEMLCSLYPRKELYDANNSRNRDLINLGKATNQVKFIPWELLDQNLIGELDVEILYVLNDIESEDDED